MMLCTARYCYGKLSTRLSVRDFEVSWYVWILPK